MKPDDYLSSDQWRTLEKATVLGRPTKVWRQRPRHVLDLLALAPETDSLDFLVQGDRRYSFAAFKAGIDKAAEAFAELGVGPGNKVLIVLYNSPEFLLAQWALFRLGAVPVFGNRWWSERELADAIERIQPSLVLSDLRPDGFKLIGPQDVASWWARPAAATIADPRESSEEDDLAAIVFTAGSTGAPKGVQLSHRNLVWSQQTIHNMRGGRPPLPAGADKQKVTLISVPMFHNGSVVTGISSLIDGDRIVLLGGRFDGGEVLRLIEEERVTNWQAVPTMFSRFLDHPSFDEHDLSSLRAPSTGGTYIPASLIEEIKAKLPNAAPNLVIGYGMTEASFLTMANMAVIEATGGSVGKAIPGVDLRIDAPDESGQGELVGRSGAIMIGYYGLAEQPIDQHGWYHTGDLGRIDSEGYVFVTGRVKDMIIRGGENIACSHVEAALLEHDDVVEAAVAGYPDKELGERVGAFVRLRPGANVSEGDLALFARTKISYFSVPTRWMFVDDPLPVLPTGKVDKMLLKRALADG